MTIRALLIDMDGTLLGKSQVAVSRRNMDALQAAIHRGVTVIPCTGRVFDMMPPQMLTQESLRYYVTCHGAVAYDRVAEKTIYQDLIPPDESAQLLEMLEGKNLYNEIAADRTIYLEASIAASLHRQPVPEHHLWYMRDQCYTAVEHLSACFREHRIGVEKMNLYGIPQEMQQELYDQLTATGFILHTRPGAGPNLEFSHCTLNKLKAVEAVLSQIGVGYSQTMALGDSSSDLDILKASALGVAMGNAPENIKACADAVTKANVEDGVAEALEKYVL